MERGRSTRHRTPRLSRRNGVTATEEFRQVDTRRLQRPVSFFAYPGKKSYLAPEDCVVQELSSPAQDAGASLRKLAMALSTMSRPRQRLLRVASRAAWQEIDGGKRSARQSATCCLKKRHSRRTGHHVGAHVVEIHSGRAAPRPADADRRLIGQGLPNAVGAAIACPDRPSSR